jgi:hypothetical protein
MVSRELSSGRLGKWAVSFEGHIKIVLWCVRLIVTGNALCLLLHQDFIRRHDQKAQGIPSIKEWESLPVESSVDKGLTDVKEIGEHRDRWTPNSTASNKRIIAHRCSGRRLWWDAERCGQPRIPWTVAGPRDMGTEGQSRVRFGQETQSNFYGAHGNAGRTREEGRNIFIKTLRRQLKCRARDKRIRGFQQAHDASVDECHVLRSSHTSLASRCELSTRENSRRQRHRIFVNLSSRPKINLTRFCHFVTLSTREQVKSIK